MKKTSMAFMKVTPASAAVAVVAGCGLMLSFTAASAAEPRREEVVIRRSPASAQANQAVVEDEDEGPKKKVEKKRIIIQDLQPSSSGGTNREVAWLGLATEESTAAVTSQVGVKEGQGLIVTFVAPDSPAGKAGMQQNDLLIEMDGQLLVHPAQLRKLVQIHKEGDEVNLAYYRGGKKQECSVKLGKTTLRGGLLFGERDAEGALQDLGRHFRELRLGDRVKDEMSKLREDLAHAGIDNETVRTEIKRSMESARKAVQDAMRQATNAQHTFGPAVREMQEIIRRGVDVDKDATVVVKSQRNAVKTIVKTDETGTYVVMANPKKTLTAHDKSGKLTFDGEIDTPEQQAAVPKDVWERVEPMVEQLHHDKDSKPEKETEEEKEDQ